MVWVAWDCVGLYWTVAGCGDVRGCAGLCGFAWDCVGGTVWDGTVWDCVGVVGRCGLCGVFVIVGVVWLYLNICYGRYPELVCVARCVSVCERVGV